MLLKQEKVPSVQIYVFQNSEHPRIDNFGYKKLSFDRLNVFSFDTNKKILVLVG